ncbi:MAG: hypothetical protein A3F11_10935 [Gammaproteobacteria bacterium RIFCSPHIGHO2_12_FULL_37_14]|nr:MAG: hypothetical protein A3F11_10935 [Gammaproteobacteria bacterium RIFCSPHIGHO2_12_FULL_37_14]
MKLIKCSLAVIAATVVSVNALANSNENFGTMAWHVNSSMHFSKIKHPGDSAFWVNFSYKTNVGDHGAGSGYVTHHLTSANINSYDNPIYAADYGSYVKMNFSVRGMSTNKTYYKCTPSVVVPTLKNNLTFTLNLGENSNCTVSITQ